MLKYIHIEIVFFTLECKKKKVCKYSELILNIYLKKYLKNNQIENAAISTKQNKSTFEQKINLGIIWQILLTS